MNSFPRSQFSHLRSSVKQYVGLMAVLGLLITVFGMLSDHFFSARTLTTIANQIPDLTVVAVGMTLVLIIGGIDLSVGSVLALSSAILGLAMIDWGLPIGLAALLAIAVGTFVGTVSGAISVWFGIPSFIVTLGMLEIARGAAYLVTDSQTKYIGKAIEFISAPLGALPISIAVLVAAAVVLTSHIMLTRTVMGRYLIAIGTNDAAVRMCGVDSRPYRIIVFGISGFLCGIGGLMQASRLSSADPNAAVGLELAAIAAAVIGGTSLMGGRGSVINTLFGVLIIAVLQTGLASVGVEEPFKRVITGSVIIGAVLLDAFRRKT